MVYYHYGIWDWWLVGFAQLVYWIHKAVPLPNSVYGFIISLWRTVTWEKYRIAFSTPIKHVFMNSNNICYQCFVLLFDLVVLICLNRLICGLVYSRHMTLCCPWINLWNRKSSIYQNINMERDKSSCTKCESTADGPGNHWDCEVIVA